MTDTQQQDRGWVWAALFLIFGIFNVIEYFYQGGTTLHPFLTGAGFLLIAPQAFLHPVRFTKPLWPQFKSAPRAATLIDWLAIFGIALLIAGVIVRWA